MEVPPVDQGDFDRRVLQFPGGVQAGKPPADDDDTVRHNSTLYYPDARAPVEGAVGLRTIRKSGAGEIPALFNFAQVERQ